MLFTMALRKRKVRDILKFLFRNRIQEWSSVLRMMELVSKMLAIVVKVNSNVGGVGLQNVDQRLKLHFGEHYQMKIDSIPSKGTTVEIYINRIETS